MNLKEKIFVALSWMAKATVQAALGPVALDTIRNNNSSDPKAQSYAEITLLVCVLSIILTAPIGAIIITLSGPRLLTKTSAPPAIPDWRRRSHRPSIRDISIIDEDDEDEDDDDEKDAGGGAGEEGSRKASVPHGEMEGSERSNKGSEPNIQQPTHNADNDGDKTS